MNPYQLIMALLALVAGTLATDSAFAWGGLSVGVNFGFPGYGPVPFYAAPPFYPAPIYYPPPVYYSAPVVIQPTPPVYVQRNDYFPAPTAPSQSFWYYCSDSRAYYPYVKNCPGGWQTVSPSPQ